MNAALVAVALLVMSAASGCESSALLETVVQPPVRAETHARCAEVVAQFSRWLGPAKLERAVDTDVAMLVRLQQQGLQRHPALAGAPLMDQHARPSDAGGVCFALADFMPCRMTGE